MMWIRAVVITGKYAVRASPRVKRNTLQVFSRPSFKKMVDIASHANHGVKLPSLKQTHGHIIKMFKQQMLVLKDWLSVGSFSDPLDSLLC